MSKKNCFSNATTFFFFLFWSLPSIVFLALFPYMVRHSKVKNLCVRVCVLVARIVKLFFWIDTVSVSVSSERTRKNDDCWLLLVTTLVILFHSFAPDTTFRFRRWSDKCRRISYNELRDSKRWSSFGYSLEISNDDTVQKYHNEQTVDAIEHFDDSLGDSSSRGSLYMHCTESCWRNTLHGRPSRKR